MPGRGITLNCMLNNLAFLYMAVGSNGLRTTNYEKDYSNNKIKRDTAATHRPPTDVEKAWSKKVADPS